MGSLKKLRYRILYILVLTIAFIALELVLDFRFLLLFTTGMALSYLSLFIKNTTLRKIVLFPALVMVLVSLALTRSFWLFIVTLLLTLLVFQDDQVNQLINLSDNWLLPNHDKLGEYHGIQLVQPQSSQRSILDKNAVWEQKSVDRSIIEWDDINLIYFGGNTIVDLGNSLFPEGEYIVMVRKMYGRLRLIIPRDIGLSLNISLISGKVIFESQSYTLALENFRWQSPDYIQAKRKIKLIVSSVFGDVEVIIL